MMGRPPKPAKDRKTESVCVRMTKAERARLERAARAGKEELSAWARAALLAAADATRKK